MFDWPSLWHLSVNLLPDDGGLRVSSGLTLKLDVCVLLDQDVLRSLDDLRTLYSIYASNHNTTVQCISVSLYPLLSQRILFIAFCSIYNFTFYAHSQQKNIYLVFDSDPDFL